MTNRFYPIVIKELSAEDGGGFIAYAPDLYGCQSDGETREEASMNVQDAICEWVDEMSRLGRDIPEPGSAERSARAAMRQLEDAVTRAADIMARNAQEMDRLRADYGALQREFAELTRKAAEGIDHWARLPADHARIGAADLPH